MFFSFGDWSYMKNWDEMLFLEGKKAIQNHFRASEKVIFVLGKGFDKRTVRFLEMFTEIISDMEVCLVDYSDSTVQRNEKNELCSNENYRRIKEICRNLKLMEFKVPQYSGSNGNNTQRISESVKSAFNKDFFNKYDHLLIDVSAMPQSVGFSIIKRALDIQSDNQKLYILVCENSEYDDKIMPVIVDDSAEYLQGFNTFSMDLIAEEDDVIWFPVLGKYEEQGFSNMAEFLKATEICPIVPFPAKDIRKSEDILRTYGNLLFDRYDIDKRNIIYVPEYYPKLISKKLYDTVCYYEKALVLGNNRTIQFAFSSQSSKLIDIGILLTVVKLIQEEKKAGIVVVENKDYNPTDSYNEADENLYCLCLDDSEFDW